MRSQSPLNVAARTDQSLSYNRSLLLLLTGSGLCFLTGLSALFVFTAGVLGHPTLYASTSELLAAAGMLLAVLAAFALVTVGTVINLATSRRRRDWLAAHADLRLL